VLFKGFYEDLIIRHEDITLRVLSEETGKYAEGDLVAVRVEKYLEY
jgi:hypothetical protein